MELVPGGRAPPGTALTKLLPEKPRAERNLVTVDLRKPMMGSR